MVPAARETAPLDGFSHVRIQLQINRLVERFINHASFTASFIHYPAGGPDSLATATCSPSASGRSNGPPRLRDARRDGQRKVLVADRQVRAVIRVGGKLLAP